jgi:RNA polymerase sigma-70 factor (ECF subfamily)
VALQTCLESLPEKQRRFLILAYTPGVKIKQLAEESGSTAAAFYMRLKRLRRKLMECVESKTQQPKHA